MDAKQRRQQSRKIKAQGAIGALATAEKALETFKTKAAAERERLEAKIVADRKAHAELLNEHTMVRCEVERLEALCGEQANQVVELSKELLETTVTLENTKKELKQSTAALIKAQAEDRDAKSLRQRLAKSKAENSELRRQVNRFEQKAAAEAREELRLRVRGPGRDEAELPPELAER
jgi:hypothetical protein